MGGTIRIQETGEFLTFDTTLDESRSDTADVTDHPVDEALNVTDHRQPQPKIVQVTARISESPTPAQTGRENDFALVVGPVQGPPPTEGKPRIDHARDFIDRASEGMVTWVGAKYGTIENLMITDVTKNIVRAGHLDFEIDFKQIRIARSQTVKIPPEAVEKPTNEPEQDNCDQVATGGFTPVPDSVYDQGSQDEVDTQTRTELKQFFDSVFG